MLIGNLSALWQKNAKRMMAYSSIAHAGFMLAGLVAFSEFGLESLLFYASIYLIMNFAAFLLIKMLSESRGIDKISDFSGLGKHLPFLGVASVIIMLSLTGLPPTAGFTAKLLIFSSVWDTYQTNHEPVLLVLFIVGLLNTVLALFYYIKIPYYLYFRSQDDENSVLLQRNQNSNFREKILLGILIFPLLILFFKSSWLTDFINLLN
jgi:NADH-quinone oxidoreductase subunit N